jgi:tRNA threonylcarbamoyl adenosine modification protein (Sua5/YciO/YrdC/YwlC family)
MFLTLNPENINPRFIDEIIDVLNNDGVIVYPTDTVYALGCKLHSKKALNKMARIKDVKLSKANFALVFDNLSKLSTYVKHFERPVFKLLNKSLPGPYTFILDANSIVPKLFDSNKKEVGIRIPNNPITLAIVEKLGEPLATTSLHDENDEILEYYIDANEIFVDFEDQVDAVIDGGLGKLYGSTVISCVGGNIEVIREGLGPVEI